MRIDCIIAALFTTFFIPPLCTQSRYDLVDSSQRRERTDVGQTRQQQYWAVRDYLSPVGLLPYSSMFPITEAKRAFVGSEGEQVQGTWTDNTWCVLNGAR